jgi:hypothetical protein
LHATADAGYRRDEKLKIKMAMRLEWNDRSFAPSTNETASDIFER